MSKKALKALKDYKKYKLLMTQLDPGSIDHITAEINARFCKSLYKKCKANERK